jgi:hypothetical protein
VIEPPLPNDSRRLESSSTLEPEKAQGRSGQIANRLVHSDLVILHELGH